MNGIKLAIIYYSMTGTNYKLAKMAENHAKSLGADVKVFKVQELAPQSVIDSNPKWKELQEKTSDIPVATNDDLVWADAILFSVPTRYGNVPAQFKQFIDQTGGIWFEGKLVNKCVSAMTSAQNPHGGQEATILSLYTTMHHWGAIVVSPGYTDAVLYGAGGNPYGTSVSVDGNGEMVEEVEPAVKHQTKRLLEITSKIKN